MGHERFLKLKQGKYSDGHPLDEVQYLECKLILKPDRFIAAKVFFEYGELARQTAKEFGIGSSDSERVRDWFFKQGGDPKATGAGGRVF